MPRDPRVSLDQIPDRDHRGVGFVANSWAYLEGAVERVIWRLADLNDHQGAAITTHMSMPQRLDAALALMRLERAETDLPDRFKTIANHIRNELAGRRNEMVHSRILSLDPDAPSIRSTYWARGELRKNPKWIDQKEYSDLADQIGDARAEVQNILSEIQHGGS